MMTALRSLLITLVVASTGSFVRGAAPAGMGTGPALQSRANLSEWELVGIVSASGEFQFRLHNVKEDRSVWMTASRSPYGFAIESVDYDRDTIRIRAGDEIRTLTLRKAAVSRAVAQSIAAGRVQSAAPIQVAQADYNRRNSLIPDIYGESESHQKYRDWTGHN